MPAELETLTTEISPQLLEKTEAYMELAGWDANEIVTHALTTLFKVAESKDYPPVIPDACLALGKLIRDGSGGPAATGKVGRERRKGLTFQPFSRHEVDDALSNMIPGASSWMVDVEKKTEEEAGENSSDPPTA